MGNKSTKTRRLANEEKKTVALYNRKGRRLGNWFDELEDEILDEAGDACMDIDDASEDEELCDSCDEESCAGCPAYAAKKAWCENEPELEASFNVTDDTEENLVQFRAMMMYNENQGEPSFAQYLYRAIRTEHHAMLEQQWEAEEQFLDIDVQLEAHRIEDDVTNLPRTLENVTKGICDCCHRPLRDCAIGPCPWGSPIAMLICEHGFNIDMAGFNDWCQVPGCEFSKPDNWMPSCSEHYDTRQGVSYPLPGIQ